MKRCSFIRNSLKDYSNSLQVAGQASRRATEPQSFDLVSPVIKITENRVAICAKARSRSVRLCVSAGVATTSAPDSSA